MSREGHAARNLDTHPLRATKVGSWADFIGDLAHFLPKLASSSRHDELGARLARSILLPAAKWQDLLSLDALANRDAPVFRSRTGKALDRSRAAGKDAGDGS